LRRGSGEDEAREKMKKGYKCVTSVLQVCYKCVTSVSYVREEKGES
jgi:hypothetical protein